MTKPDFTTIQIKKETRELLKQAGKMGESYDGLLRRLLKEECEGRE